jgi:hypothetical protein
MSIVVMHILALSQDGTTGHLTLHACIVEKEGENEMRGAPETHGIDPLALAGLYGDAEGCVDKWLKDVKKRMLDRHAIRKGLHADLLSRVGKQI